MYIAKGIKVYPVKLKPILVGVVAIQICILCDCKMNVTF